MPVTKSTALKRTITPSPEVINKAKKAAVSTKYTFSFAHQSELVKPAEIEVVCDLTEKSYTFNQQVMVVWKKVCHTGCQPPKQFDKKDGTGKYNKGVSTEFIIDFDDEENKLALMTLSNLNNAIARVFEEQLKEKLNVSARFVGAEIARMTDTSYIVDVPYTRSELQIAGRKEGVAPKWLGPTDVTELRSNFFNEYPDADINSAVVKTEPTEDGLTEYILHIKEAKTYYEMLYGLIQSRVTEPEEFKYVSYPDKIVSVACTVVGGRCWFSEKTQFYNVKSNIYLDRIRVYLDGERDNGDNAKWAMRFYIPRLTTEAASFLETM